MKKLLFLPLLILCIAAMTLTAFAFSDVPLDYEYAYAINYVDGIGIMGGYEDGTFKPESHITRAEVTKLIYGFYTTHYEVDRGTQTFKDVPTTHWANGYINWCAEKGIINEFGDNYFRPDSNCTYIEALKMLCGALGYTDWSQTTWQTEVTQLANELRLNHNVPANISNSHKITRGLFSQLLYNALWASMNESKIEYKEILIGGTSFWQPIEIPKTLAEDTWNIQEEVFSIIGTKSYGKPTSSDKTILLLSKQDSSEISINLNDIGLDEYLGKTNNLINLQLTLHKTNQNNYFIGTVNGTIIDNVTVVSPIETSSITINNIKYTVSDFNPHSEHHISIYNIDGTKNNIITVFNNDKFTSEFKALFNKSVLVRIIDFDGDGYIDALIPVPKYAFKVTSIFNSSGTKYIKYQSLDSTIEDKIPANDIPLELSMDDIFIGCKMGDNFYVELLSGVLTYGTKIYTSDGRLYLHNISGEIKTKNISILGVPEIITNSKAVLGSSQARMYYIYNGELIYVNPPTDTIIYSSYVLKYVDKINDNYYAYIDDHGTEKCLLLEKLIIGNTSYTPPEAYNSFKPDIYPDGSIKYCYTLILDYYGSNSKYTLVANNIDEESDYYLVIPKGATIRYNEATSLFTIGDTTKIIFDDSSLIYYTYKKPHLTGEQLHLGLYTESSVPKVNFSATTISETYLRKRSSGTYELISAFIDNKIVIPPTISSKNQQAITGEAISIPLSVANNPGISGMIFEIYYDENIEFISATKGDALMSLSMFLTTETTANPIKIALGGTSTDYSNGIFANLNFKIKEGYAGDVYQIGIKVSEAYDEDTNSLSIPNTMSSITVIDYILGDTNNDNTVDLKDVTHLRRFLAGGYGIESVTKAADVNQDGTVDLKDVTHLRRYLAGGYGITLK